MVRDFSDANEFAPMNEEMGILFAEACMRELLPGEIPVFDEAIAQSLGFAAQVMERRLTVMSPKTHISLGVAVMLSYLCKGNPGRAVLWAYTMHRLSAKHDWKMITMTELAHAFPIGFPTDKAFMELWDSQKSNVADSDNLLDVAETWLAA